MSSLDPTFETLLKQLAKPNVLSPSRSDPIFYFVHTPEETLTVKKNIPRWASRLEQNGWNVKVVSFSSIIWYLIDSKECWEEWLELEPNYDFPERNESIRSVLRSDDGILNKVIQIHDTLDQKTVLLLTDAGLLHPYFRVRTLETNLHDKVNNPIVIFYPGRRSGQHGLHFLNFYTFDGNYRCTVLGGER